ncbi:hypothetical protein [Xenorhabdus lircayensis]|uniref:DUF3850 domain-containing protein n=1 Tax=Xenorhabdus lircayensis TaxID=2763499 RepID=A0ABS0U5Z7_9GAMM|nr:hypothetical protein [Xenorhabdus lircayensis]MBI6548889.1 hypothetical protein [Xenorhabdus lircayensis]
MERVHNINLCISVFDDVVEINKVGVSDREYFDSQPDDILVIREYNYPRNKYTGRNVLVRVERVEYRYPGLYLVFFEKINPVDFFSVQGG